MLRMLGVVAYNRQSSNVVLVCKLVTNSLLLVVDEGRAESGESGGEEPDGRDSAAEGEYISKWLCVIQETPGL